jgi:hypothetical protein
MVTAIVGGIVLSTFSLLWYLEDREGGGLYDPDPTASDRYRRNRK